MISLPLLKQTTKSNYKTVLIFLAILTMYFTIIIGMYDPATQDSMEELLKTMPQELISAMGFNLFDTSLTGFLASYLYGFLVLMFPMIYDIIVSNRMIAKHVDRGSMAYLLSTPNTRLKVVITQGKFLIGSITVIIGFITILGIIFSELNFPGLLDINRFIMLNLGALLLHYAISGIGFLSSCIFNDTKDSLLFGAGIPVLFMLIQMLANASDKLKNLKYFTMYTLFNPEEIVSNANNVIPNFVILLAISIILYSLSIIIFNKKDLPL